MLNSPEWLFLPFGLLFVGSFVVWIWALVDAIQVPDDSMYRSGTKLVWVLVIVLTQVVGAIIYFAIGRPSRRAAPSGPPPPPPPPPPPAPSSG
jgi:Phospholipase_D-nuclease N-terminal